MVSQFSHCVSVSSFPFSRTAQCETIIGNTAVLIDFVVVLSVPSSSWDLYWIGVLILGSIWWPCCTSLVVDRHRQLLSECFAPWQSLRVQCVSCSSQIFRPQIAFYLIDCPKQAWGSSVRLIISHFAKKLPQFSLWTVKSSPIKECLSPTEAKMMDMPFLDSC